MSAREQRGDVRSELYKRNLDYSLKELQKQIQEHEDQLEMVRKPELDLPKLYDTLPLPCLLLNPRPAPNQCDIPTRDHPIPHRDPNRDEASFR